MVDLAKSYRTRDGCKVKITTVTGEVFPVHGEIAREGKTFPYRWYADGSRNGRSVSGFDLVEEEDKHG